MREAGGIWRGGFAGAGWGCFLEAGYLWWEA